MHKLLRRENLPGLGEVDLATRQEVRRRVRRYQRRSPGDLVHLDIKELGRIPDGGGWRVHGRAFGGRSSAAHRDAGRPRRVPGRKVAALPLGAAIDTMATPTTAGPRSVKELDVLDGEAAHHVRDVHLYPG